MMVTFFSACNKNRDDVEIEYLKDSSKLIGKWRMTEMVTSGFLGPATSHDYSQYNIVYEFKANGIVSISGETDDVGNHSFFFEYDKTYDLHSLKIGHQWYLASISSGELMLDNRPLDGSLYKLIKIK